MIEAALDAEAMASVFDFILGLCTYYIYQRFKKHRRGVLGMDDNGDEGGVVCENGFKHASVDEIIDWLHDEWGNEPLTHAEVL